MLFLVKKKTTEEWINEIKTNNIEDINMCIKRIKDTLDKKHKYIELVEDSRIMSLKCPIMFTLIKLPVRGIYCTHLNCFDLESYALMNKTTTSRKYRCPICGFKA